MWTGRVLQRQPVNMATYDTATPRRELGRQAVIKLEHHRGMTMLGPATFGKKK